MVHMNYKLPERISTAKWAQHVLFKNPMRRLKVAIWYPVRKRLKRRFILDTTTVPSAKVFLEELDKVEKLLIDTQKARNDRLTLMLEGKKEILRWIINYGR